MTDVLDRAGELSGFNAATVPAAQDTVPFVRLYYWKSAQGNFGDDLNAWLWHAVLPPGCAYRPETVLVGIGTLLNAETPRDGVKAVLGSGVGYGRLSADMRRDRVGWRFFAVRGPLTARILDLPPQTAVTDGAVLLRTLPEFQKLPRHGKIVFVPHWRSARTGLWRRACHLVGVRYVDPRHDSREVVKTIAGASLVLAESMHAAIVADTFRVPWIPMVSARTINQLKWHDWCASLGLRYRPMVGYLVSPLDQLRAQLLGPTQYRPPRIEDPGRLIDELLSRPATEAAPSVRQRARGALCTAARVAADTAARALARAEVGGMSRQAIDEDGAQILNRAMHGHAYLSSRTALERATERMQEAVDRFVCEHAVP